ncbi:hypothetical protein GH714_008200 [Hevea brasiliensis]|uniref:Uncharacterized protein n=1 Tax=Hevea brasiliensis TaxID=3981 RepID=A0A6A6LZX0_HEVBR|nr:hypothetical protein GH714_008200 [Hevea brasiliensis]
MSLTQNTCLQALLLSPLELAAHLQDRMAKYGFLALSSAIVAFAGLYICSRITINPDRVYRMAMRKLNTSAGILEVMGAPFTGAELRAYVMSGGGITLKNFKPRLRSKCSFLIFPIRGSERKGLVSVEVKKKKARLAFYDMKLLAVDIPMALGPDQRLFLIGDEDEYKVGGGLISELRDPVVKAMAASKEFDDLDQNEEEEDVARELQEAERRHREEIEKLERDGSYGLYICSRITINPDRVYRMAMRKLNTSAGILEVMGAPFTGAELRAYVMSGGGITLKNFKPRLRSKCSFLIFPIRGSERKGLVSVEVKKKKGQYDMKLLAVDIPMALGPDQRLFLIGDEDEYKVGGGLISELRDPVVKAMAASKEFDDLDQNEEEEDVARELQEAERRHREEIEKLERDGS